MKQLPLTHGKFVIVDDEDYPYLSKFKWHLSNSKGETVETLIQGRRADRTIPCHIPMERFLVRDRPNHCILHKNKNRLDFRKENLFFSSHGGKKQRAKKQEGTSSIYKGVSFKKTNSNWSAQIGFNGKKIYIGQYPTQRQAAIAYNAKAKELFGDLAYQNDVKDTLSDAIAYQHTPLA